MLAKRPNKINEDKPNLQTSERHIYGNWAENIVTTKPNGVSTIRLHKKKKKK
jgi:hypothetical protein